MKVTALFFVFILLYVSNALSKDIFMMKLKNGNTKILSDYEITKTYLKYTELLSGINGGIGTNKIQNIKQLPIFFEKKEDILNYKDELYEYCQVISIINNLKNKIKNNVYIKDNRKIFLNDTINKIKNNNNVDCNNNSKILQIEESVNIYFDAATHFKISGDDYQYNKLNLLGFLCQAVATKLSIEYSLINEGVVVNQNNEEFSVCYIGSEDFKIQIITSGDNKELKEQYNQNKTTIKSFCKKKWKNDYEMVEYCMDNQMKAKHSLSGKNDLQVLNFCQKKWGNDYQMIEYCYDRQRESKDKIEH